MSNPAELYLDLLARTLTGMAWQDPPIPTSWLGDPPGYDEKRRIIGFDWPQHAPCMIGPVRLGNVRDCVEQVIADDIPGDLAETGAWRGGTCIYMRALLQLYDVTDRDVWVMDSFAGLPRPQADEEGWAGDSMEPLAVPLPRVRHNFALYGLLDEQVKFLPGWFADTLPGWDGQLAVLRMDADLYASTSVILEHLYPKVSDGGFVIVDDWTLPARRAVEDYRAAHGITDPIRPVEGAEWGGGPMSVFWRKDDADGR